MIYHSPFFGFFSSSCAENHIISFDNGFNGFLRVVGKFANLNRLVNIMFLVYLFLFVNKDGMQISVIQLSDCERCMVHKIAKLRQKHETQG